MRKVTGTDFDSPGGTRSRVRFRRAGFALLALTAAVVILIVVVVARFLHNNDPDRKLRSIVEQVQEDLRTAAGDGVLTDEEVLTRTARLPDGDAKVRQDESSLRFDTTIHAVTSNFFGSSGKSACYTFTVSKPLSSSSVVTAVEISCDAVK